MRNFNAEPQSRKDAIGKKNLPLFFASLRLGVLALIFSAFGVSAANLVTISLTVTNIPATSNTFYWSTASGSLRTWTNATTASTILTNVAGINQSATNLFNALANYPLLGVTIAMTNTNTLTFRGSSLIVTQGGNWAQLLTNTLTGTNVYEFVGPFDNQPAQTRTNQASEWIYGISLYPTNALPTNAVALSNFLSLGVGSGGGVQKVTAPKIFNSFSGNISKATNGYWTNGIAENLTVTNLSSPGPGALSLQLGSNSVASSLRDTSLGVNTWTTNQDALAVGSGAWATNSFTTAVGSVALAGGTDDTAIGSGAHALGGASFAGGANATATGDNSVSLGNSDTIASAQFAAAIGPGATASKSASLALGNYPTASAPNATAVGSLANATHTNSTAVGQGATTTTNNQVRLGTASEVVSVPGRLEALTATNSSWTGSNQFIGTLAFVPVTVTSMAAGVNAAVPGTNVLIEITGTPGAAWSIAGITGGRAGRVITIYNSTGYAMTVANQSGSDPTPANRIITLQGTDLVTAANSVVDLFYSALQSRWIVRNHYP